MIYHIHSVYIYIYYIYADRSYMYISHTCIYMVVLIYAYSYGINYPGLRWSLVFLVPRLQVLLDETFKTRSTRDRQGKMPKRLRLVKCHRLEDSSMWSWYLSRCLVQIEPTLKCPEIRQRWYQQVFFSFLFVMISSCSKRNTATWDSPQRSAFRWQSEA